MAMATATATAMAISSTPLRHSSLADLAQAWSSFCTFLSDLPTLRRPIDHTPLLKSLQLLLPHGLRSTLLDYFLNYMEISFKQHCESSLWRRFDAFLQLKEKSKETGETIQLNEWIQSTLPQALQDVYIMKQSHEEYISILEVALRVCGQHLSQSERSQTSGIVATSEDLGCKYQTSVTALLLTNSPKYFSDILNLYFKSRLEDFSRVAKEHGGAKDDESQLDDHDVNESDDLGIYVGGQRDSLSDEDMDMIENEGLGGIHVRDDVCSMEYVAEMGVPWVTEVVEVVKSLQQLGFSAMTEEACASAVYSLLKDKCHGVAAKHYEKPVLGPLRRWIKAIPLRFLQIVLDTGAPSPGDLPKSLELPSPLASTPFANMKKSHEANERLTRWHLRLEFFAYETLGNLRISELFDIIVDYPESLAAIEDLRQCLANTGHHTKLVESFRIALRHRLLTAGAATTDILLQYISTIKALRTMDHTGVFLEAVGEPIREYLRSRKDTIRCIVTMLTDDTGAGGASSLGGVGESLLEELSRGTTMIDNIDSEDEGVDDDEEAWTAAQRWEPDPVEADPTRTSKSRRTMDIIGMLVGIYGSKELFVNEYRIMLAEKLLSKSDYDIDREIRTLELLKLRFGENSMHSCEIMLKDIADSKRINSNIKANTFALGKASAIASPSSIALGTPRTEYPRRLAAFVARARGVFSQSEQLSGAQLNMSAELKEKDLSLEVLDATIISSLFWPPFQTETVKIPDAVDELLEEYAQRYHSLKTPRKLQWKKNLGIVKLELQFEDRSEQFMVSPMHASIIMLFEDCSSWAARDLAAALDVPVSTLRRRITLWVNQGVLLESSGAKPGELYYTIIENIGDFGNRNGPRSADSALPLLGEEDGESAVASMEDQLQQEMNVYESYVLGMLTNFDSLPLDRIHNMLKMFVSDPPYDKSLQQLQGFLAGLISEEKLEVRDGLYRRRQQ